MINYADLDDASLLKLMKNNDQEAFTAIYNKYWYPLMQHVMKVVRIYTEAEDIVQEIFVSIWKTATAWKSRRRLPPTWFNSARYMGIRNKKGISPVPTTCNACPISWTTAGCHPGNPLAHARPRRKNRAGHSKPAGKDEGNI